MIKLYRNERLKELKWKYALQCSVHGCSLILWENYRQILQVHDELILEGPSESAEEALQIVLQMMESVQLLISFICVVLT